MPSVHESARRARSGFTLAELLLSLVAVALIAALSISAWFGRSEVTLEAAVDLLVLDIRAAQARAAFFRVPVELAFLPDGRGYDVIEPALDQDSILGPPMSARRFDHGAVFEDVRIGRVELGRTQRLMFNAIGQALEGGRIEVRYGDESRTVEIEPRTGRVRVPERSPHWDDTGR
jgi:prepilin-type N-terminal cleavage/methylation domain-containing protein